MHGDLELACRCLVHVAGELLDVLGVEIGGRVGVGMSHLVWAETEKARPAASSAATDLLNGESSFISSPDVSEVRSSSYHTESDRSG